MSTFFHLKRALVTGAGKGIGRAIALRLANMGANVHAISRTKSDLDSLKEECTDIDVYNVDIADWDKTRSVLQSIGPVEMLVNNAGVVYPSAFLETSKDQLDNQLDINFKAAFNISQVVAKGMVERGKGGSIVNMSSAVGIKVVDNTTVYSVSKAALDMLTRSMAAELGPHNIRVNSINPGLVSTAMILKCGISEEFQQHYINRSPIKRLVEINDVVNATIFLLSDQAAMTNGIILPVEGGLVNNLVWHTLITW